MPCIFHGYEKMRFGITPSASIFSAKKVWPEGGFVELLSSDKHISCIVGRFSGVFECAVDQKQTSKREDGCYGHFHRPLCHFRLRFEVFSSLFGFSLALIFTFFAYRFADRSLDAVESGNKARGFFSAC